MCFPLFYEHQRSSYGHQMNNNETEQRESSFLSCQKSLGKRLWCWARLIERLFDFWHDWRQHIGPCMLPKRHGQHHRLPSHTRVTRLFLWTLSLCHSQRAVGCSRPAPCSQDVGSGPGPEARKEGRSTEGGWRLRLGTQSARWFGPSACHSTAPGHCTVWKKQPSKGRECLTETEWERAWRRVEAASFRTWHWLSGALFLSFAAANPLYSGLSRSVAN